MFQFIWRCEGSTVGSAKGSTWVCCGCGICEFSGSQVCSHQACILSMVAFLGQPRLRRVCSCSVRFVFWAHRNTYMWEFPTIRGTLFGGPCNMDPNI